MYLSFESFCFRCGGGSGFFAGFSDFLHLFELLGHSLIGCFTVVRLRSSFRSRHDETARPVFEPDGGLDLVAMLTAGASGDIEFEVAIPFE